jgi:hypothetical protein
MYCGVYLRKMQNTYIYYRFIDSASDKCLFRSVTHSMIVHYQYNVLRHVYREHEQYVQNAGIMYV